MVVAMQMGSVHTVTVKRLLDFGAIVEFSTGSSTLLHISNLSHTRVNFSPSAFPWRTRLAASLNLAVHDSHDNSQCLCRASSHILVLRALLLAHGFVFVC